MLVLNTQIRHKIEARFGRPVNYSKDCEALSRSIAKTCGERISVTTLKRLFGFAKGVEKPRLFTLDVLAVYAGFKDWSALLAETKAAEEQTDALFSLIVNNTQKDLYRLQHQLLQNLATNSIDFHQTESLCRKFGKQPEITSFIIELVNLAGRTKDLLFLKNIFSLPHIFNEKYHSMAHLYYISQAIGVVLRNNEDLAHELIPVYGAHPLAQKYFVEWFVDEDYLTGYYGKLLDVYHRNKKSKKADLLFYYALKYSACMQTGAVEQGKQWIQKLKGLNIKHPVHHIPAGRYFGILLSGEPISQTAKLKLIDKTFKQYLFTEHYESAIAFTLFLCRYLYGNRENELLMLVTELFTAYWEKQTNKFKTHWGIKMENELQVYLAYGLFLSNARKKAAKYIHAVDPDLFEIFWFKQMHSDYSSIAALINQVK